MIRFKIDMWGMKAGDAVPAHKIDELKANAPEVIYDDEAEKGKKAAATNDKMIHNSPMDKGVK